ncbi:MAG TPA: DUF2231 domain-containing protein [Mycobacteriales bacterium]|nr:DUF2231 domain-containing protein [Mycobacteriales bacterium]
MSSGTALGLSTINGLPAHVLLVHLVVVFVPLSGIVLIVAAVRDSAARRLGIWLPLLAAVAFLSVLAAMNAGGWLQSHVANTALVRKHTQIAGQLWPFSAAVLLLALVVWWRRGRTQNMGADAPADAARSGWRALAPLDAVVLVACVVIAAGSIVEVYRIGDSGSRAAWHNHFSAAATAERPIAHAALGRND